MPTPSPRLSGRRADVRDPETDRRGGERRVVERRDGDAPSLWDGVERGPTATLALLVAVLERESRIVRDPLVGDSFLKPGWNA
jgi:hypothetical protein